MNVCLRKRYKRLRRGCSLKGKVVYWFVFKRELIDIIRV